MQSQKILDFNRTLAFYFRGYSTRNSGLERKLLGFIPRFPLRLLKDLTLRIAVIPADSLKKWVMELFTISEQFEFKWPKSVDLQTF